MIPSYRASCGRDTRRGLRMMAMMMRMSNQKYRLYAEAKARIPKNLPPKEYEERVRKLAKRYKI